MKTAVVSRVLATAIFFVCPEDLLRFIALIWLKSTNFADLLTQIVHWLLRV